MATYKVLQDVEAEDKILGPLTLRQFIYAGVTVILLYLSYFVFTKGLGIMAVLFLPMAAVFGFFAFPWSRDQPTEVWALAKIRFLFKPRKRIWDQSGLKELVTITAPKHIEEIAYSRLSQTEVKSRLRALADTIDTRGWATKNASVNTPAVASPFTLQQPTTSDRLLEVNTTTPTTMPIANDVRDADDILDEKANPRAQKVDSMISASAQAHRQKLMQELQAPTPTTPAPTSAQTQPSANYWFLNQPASPPAGAPRGNVTFGTQTVEPGTSSTTTPVAAVDEEALVHELEARKEEGPNSSYYGHLRTIEPISAQKAQAAKRATEAATITAAQQPSLPPPPPPVTPAEQAAILRLASNKDLNISTIAREAKRSGPDDEVVIKLH